jgi:hypothetical protein
MVTCPPTESPRVSLWDLTVARGVSCDLGHPLQLAQWPVKNNQLHHSISTISTAKAQPTST